MFDLKIKKKIIRLYIKFLEYLYIPYFFYKLTVSRGDDFSIKPLRGFFDSGEDHLRTKANEGMFKQAN